MSKDIESILVISKYLTLCCSDDEKLSITRKYLSEKISKILESKRYQSQPIKNYFSIPKKSNFLKIF